MTNLTEITLDELYDKLYNDKDNGFEYLPFKAVLLGLHENIRKLSSHIVYIHSLGQLKVHPVNLQWDVVP